VRKILSLLLLVLSFYASSQINLATRPYQDTNIKVLRQIRSALTGTSSGSSSVTVINQPSVTVLNPSVSIIGTPTVSIGSSTVTVANPSVTVLNPSVSVINTVTIAPNTTSVVNSVSLATNSQLTSINNNIGAVVGVQYASSLTSVTFEAGDPGTLAGDVDSYFLSLPTARIKFLSYSITAYWDGVSNIKNYSVYIMYQP
jgi:hypothetical protein